MNKNQPKKQQPIAVTQADEVAPEVLAKAIVEISNAASKLLNGPLTKRAVLVLIKDACPAGIGLSDIDIVLTAAAGLGKRFVRSKS